MARATVKRAASPRARAPKVRAGKASDSPALAALVAALSYETPFVLRLPGERLPKAKVMRKGIAAGIRRGTYGLFVADAGDSLVGFCEAYGSPFRRMAHKAFLVIAIREAHTGKGLGSAMLRAAERWARRRSVRRLELFVSTANPRAHRLYRRLGFVEEGRRRDAWIIGGRYVDDIAMVKLLPAKRRAWPKGVR